MDVKYVADLDTTSMEAQMLELSVLKNWLPFSDTYSRYSRYVFVSRCTIIYGSDLVAIVEQVEGIRAIIVRFHSSSLLSYSERGGIHKPRIPERVGMGVNQKFTFGCPLKFVFYKKILKNLVQAETCMFCLHENICMLVCTQHFNFLNFILKNYF